MWATLALALLATAPAPPVVALLPLRPWARRRTSSTRWR